MTKTEEEMSRKLPHVFGHRGYSAKYPENTVISFEKAVEAGTTALEGDIRITKDGELVMMHDLTLQRTTTGTGVIYEKEWSYIASLETKTVPPQRIPRLNDVFDMLVGFVSSKYPDLYMIIDIKFDTNIAVLDALKNLLDKEKYAVLKNHITIGIWNTEYLKRAKLLFPGYQLCFIGYSLPGARTHFLDSVDCISLPFVVLYGEEGQKFIADAHEAQKKVYCWTVNAIDRMQACVVWEIDGIIGDDIEVLLKHVQHEPKAKSNEIFEVYRKTADLPPSRIQLIKYYTVKKILYWISRIFIGV